MRGVLWLRWIRWPELLMLSAPSVFGYLLATEPSPDPARLCLFIVATLAGGGHVMSFNTVLGHRTAAHDTEVMDYPLRPDEYRPGAILALGTALAALSFLLLAALSVPAFLIGVLISAVWLLYVHPRTLLKGRPIADSAVHVVGGYLHFWLGVAAGGGPPTTQLAVWSTYFVLIFVAGHLHHVIKDRGPDRAAALRTSAVVMGPRFCFGLGSLLFLGAHSTALFILQARQPGSSARLVILLLALAHAGAAARYAPDVARGDPGAVIGYRRIYRILFALEGGVVLSALLPP